MMPAKFKKVLWIAAALLIAFLGLVFYSLLQPGTAGSGLVTVLMLVLGLCLGGLIVFLLVRGNEKPPVIVQESSHTIAESMRKVFKIVSAEGHFQEIYNFEETRKLMNFIPSTKKALVIVQAKILVGYDFEKCQWEVD